MCDVYNCLIHYPIGKRSKDNKGIEFILLCTNNVHYNIISTITVRDNNNIVVCVLCVPTWYECSN